MRFTSHLLADFEAVTFRQLKIEKNEIWPCLMPTFDRLFAIKCPDHVISMSLEPEAQQVYHVAVMIGHHDFHRVAPHIPVFVPGEGEFVFALVSRFEHRELLSSWTIRLDRPSCCHLFPLLG